MIFLFLACPWASIYSYFSLSFPLQVACVPRLAILRITTKMYTCVFHWSWWSMFFIAQFIFIKTQWPITIWRPHKILKICFVSGSCQTFYFKQLSVMISAEICEYEIHINTDGTNNRMKLHMPSALGSHSKWYVTLSEVTLTCFTRNRSFNRLAHGGLNYHSWYYSCIQFGLQNSYQFWVLCSQFKT